MAGHQRRHPDAQVDVGAAGQLPRHPGRELVPGGSQQEPPPSRRVRNSICFSAPEASTTRCTWMPGVRTASGSISPGARRGARPRRS
ncbi:hypothetical protein TOK_5759 [Pseudonocardia sp. N23]|nr:hypothetical protein TOK_5759 [Pseudonocardia sp. N23]